MALEILIWKVALVTSAIAVVVGVFTIVWIWRSSRPNRLLWIMPMVALTAMEFAAVASSVSALLRLRADP
jgi:ABC-type spermidine/putrescine transport system permease subunit II